MYSIRSPNGALNKEIMQLRASAQKIRKNEKRR